MKIFLQHEIGKNGIEFSVKDSRKKHLGDFYIRKGGIVWCDGKTAVQNGASLPWKKMIALANNKWKP